MAASRVPAAASGKGKPASAGRADRLQWPDAPRRRPAREPHTHPHPYPPLPRPARPRHTSAPLGPPVRSRCRGLAAWHDRPGVPALEHTPQAGHRPRRRPRVAALQGGAGGGGDLGVVLRDGQPAPVRRWVTSASTRSSRTCASPASATGSSPRHAAATSPPVPSPSPPAGPSRTSASTASNSATPSATTPPVGSPSSAGSGTRGRCGARCSRRAGRTPSGTYTCTPA